MKSVQFKEGDVFYTGEKNEFHVFKLLVNEPAFHCYHVLVYEPITYIPDSTFLNSRKIQMYHIPVDSKGFPGASFLVNEKVTASELIGYHEYLRQTQGMDFCIEFAKELYQKAYYLTDENKHEEAIDFYSQAADLVPHFYQAIDNRAFCKMDLGRWEEAIDDFTKSLVIFPNSTRAEFSIGECYFRMKKFTQAREQFLKVLELNPNHELSKEFLLKIPQR
jgi:tetratricopeptide (TPR) repeat protein